MKKRILLASFILAFVSVSAQVVPQSVPDFAKLNKQEASPLKKVNLNSQISRLKSFSKSNQLEISLPTTKATERFVLIERDLLSPSLREQFPDIKSYYGYSANNPNVKITASYSLSNGFSAFIYGDIEKQVLNKIEGDTYGVYGENNIPGLKDFSCGTPEKSDFISDSNANKSNPNTYRKYRLAVATDYDYNLYHAKGGTITLEKSLAAVVAAVSILSTVYENDLSISFELISGMDKVAFLTRESDPFTTANLNSQTQIQLDSKIGNANYDLGILFTSKLSGGNAGSIGNVCRNGVKGSAYIGYITANTPEGFTFSMAAGHEMGHQFGGNHTHSRNEYAGANREIGSGVTVMGYAGVTGTHDVAPTFIPQFFNNTLVQINDYLAGQTCGTTKPSTNKIPVVVAGNNYSIPQGTAFRLTGSATDADTADKLTYSWEQNDPLTDITGNYFKDPSAKNLNGANYRVYAASNNPVQYFPPIKEVLNGSLSSTWNTPPTVSKTMNFVLLARDNRSGGGQTGTAAMKINVTNNAPFRITNIDLNQTIKSGQSFELKWDVAGTDAGTINAKNVKISLTTDDGETFNTLIASTANDGSELITIPSSLRAKKANIIVEAIGNIFYAASPPIAVDYAVTLACNEYYASSGANIPDVGNITRNVIVNNSNTDIIEDFSIITDIAHTRSSDLSIYLRKSTIDDDYRLIVNKRCGNIAYPNFVFNVNGGSAYENCGTNAVVQPMTIEYFKNYIGAPVAGNYSLIIVDDVAGATGRINKLGIKVCKRTETFLNAFDAETNNTAAKIFPNPSNGNFNVRYSSQSKDYKIEIYNVVGQLVNSTVVNDKADKNFNLNSLAKGLYILKIIDGDNTQSQKLIIK